MARRPRGPRRLLRVGALAVLVAVLLQVAVVALLRVVDPPTTAFIARERVATWLAGDARRRVPHQLWRDYGRISRELALAVVASEDQLFPRHHGFDLNQIQKALDEAGRGGRARGASTISQQVAKNLFLWNGRSWIRKGAEAWFTVLIEALWPKRRILEVYLNVAEFGPGIYGAEVASRAWFHKPAARLTRAEAARLAAVLPNPKRLSVNRPGPYVLQRQGEIERQMAALGGTTWLDSL